MKKRLDQILIDNNLLENKSKARSYILDGNVIVNNEKIIKAGTMFDETKINISIIKKENEFVSRAGDKLFKALKKWEIDLSDLVCLDIGSSTGGFTQCCLKFNARKVYALDVGTNQLDWKIRQDPRVISMEKTNFRYVEKEQFDEEINFYCCDVSFISLSKILPTLNNIININSKGIMLIKPQFESERHEIKNGQILDKNIHLKDIKKVFDYIIENNFSIINLDFSPILGNKKKNIEYLVYIQKNQEIKKMITEDQIRNVINDAWKYFSGDLNG